MCITKYARDIIENLHTSIVSVNYEGKITDVNEAMVNVTGIQRKDLIGTDFFGYFTEPSLAQEVCRRVFSEGSILQYHLVLKHINGGKTDVMCDSFVFNGALENKTAIFIVRNIHADESAAGKLKKIRESFLNMRQIFRIGNWEFDIVNNKLQWSDEIYTIFEIDPVKFGATYEAFLEAVHPADREAVKSAYENSLKNRTPYEMEHRIVTPSRIVKYVLEHCETFYDSEGAPLRSVGVMQDITDRKQIENMLKESRSKLVEAQHIAHIGNWELDIVENKVIWSNEVYYIYETDPASFGATYADFINAVHPADREAINSAYKDSVIKKIPCSLDHRILMPDGRVKYVHEYWKTFYDVDGAPVRSAGTVQDITARKQAEEKLRILSSRQQALLAAIPDIIMEVDTNKIYRWANKAGLEFFGDDVCGESADFYFAGEQKVYDLVNPIFQGNENIVYLESWQKRKDGENRLLAWWCRSLKDGAGNVTGAISSARDITEQKQAEESLKIRTEELTAVNKELESFVTMAAHDLKEPIRGMQVFSQFLLDDYSEKLDDTGKDYIRRIALGGKRASMLIDDLLRLSRISRVKNPYSMIDSGKLVKKVLEQLEHFIEKKKAKIKMTGKFPIVFGDDIKLKVVFNNLISNGIIYSDKSNPEIKIKAEDSEKEVRFSVEDNGIGIKKEYFEDIFKMFKRLHSRQEYGGGTGAGLAIVKKIIEEHNGKLWVESEIGKGSIFFFTIPKVLKHPNN